MLGKAWLFIQGIFYSIGIRLLQGIMGLGSIWSPKLKQGLEGRKHLFSRLELALQALPTGQKKYWFHCASLGEFEQGRPVIELLRKQKPNAQILLSFFSPSGYEIRKDYQHADFVFYLPIDSKANARRIVNLIQPDFFLLVKYEFWLNLISSLGNSKCKTILFSAIFRPNQWFFKPWLTIGKTSLDAFDQIFVQDESSAQLLKSIKIDQVEVNGDTRIDRVVEQAAHVKELPLIKAFVGQANKVLVAGSTWEPDEELLATLFQNEDYKDWKFIIAPHEIHEAHIHKVQVLFRTQGIRYSQTTKNSREGNILFLDTIGDLSAAYQFATHAYIGGGFGSGIHNILEPLAFGIPVIFGPNYQKFREAHEVIKLEAGYSVKNSQDLHDKIQHTLPSHTYQTIQQNGLRYLASNKGASRQILEYVCTFD